LRRYKNPATPPLAAVPRHGQEGDEYKKISKETLANKYKNIDKMLEAQQYLMGDKFTVADAYLYTVTRWAPRVELDLSPPSWGA
jgi:glutathione S-transferase